MPVGRIRAGAAIAVLVGACGLSGCGGNRLPAVELQQAAGLGAPAAGNAESTVDASAPGSSTGVGTPAAPDVATAPIAPAGAAAGGPAGVTGTSASTPGAPATPHAAGAKPSAPAVGTAGGPKASVPVAGGRCVASCADIVIGSVGTYSGIVGQNVGPGVRGVQAWVADTNARGGINGHQVRFVVADDGGDPARQRALVQQQVEQRGVVAFVYNAAPLSGQASVDYLNKVRVPVIGSEGGSDWFNQSPMFFPQNSSGKQLVLTPVASATVSMLPKGIKKLGLMYCSDGIQVCEDARQLVPEESKKYGFDFVYNGSGSLAQPDFTANCLAAQNAGAQMILMMMDRNSAQRVARGCSNVGYKPVILLSQTVETDALATDPNLQGSVGVSLVAPWFDTTNPAVAKFRKAMATYAPGVDMSGTPILGWAAAKLLERSLSTITGTVINPASILAGLWSIKGDTLGGLTPALTYVKERPTGRYVCFWPLIISGKKFVNAGDGKSRCI
jgi:branched-chain amino acid transport system substrate-binding protein